MDKLDSGDQTGLFYTTHPVFYTSGNRFVQPWNGQILQAFSWSGWKDPLKFVFLCEFK
jgi:hypothetical protein